MTLEPIGIFRTESKFPYEARRQATATGAGASGEIQLFANRGFEQAIEDLAGFERIWIIYHFHRNDDWKPKVMPPRGPRQKRGVFATRAPYRPNAIGMSCVRLISVDKLSVTVEGHDLLDSTPVLDIKPYLPYADSFPNAKVGWLEEVEEAGWSVEISPAAEKQIAWLEENAVTQLRGFVQGQLEFEPLDAKRKRVEVWGEGFRLKYRTWRVIFKAEPEKKMIQVQAIETGYSKEDLARSEDPYLDKDLHREFFKLN